MNETNIDAVTRLALKLWPEHEWHQLYAEFKEMLASEHDMVYLAMINDQYVGFIYMSIRYDYVEGSSSSPVGYVEGLYVEENYRLKGISRKLVEQGEQWSKSMGCTEMGSDTWLDNYESQQFHISIGFKEAGRIVAFIKNIE